ncbi:CrcB family protein [Halorussus limi]|uniref:Fluoride-specific ion channel FluC n=1 Tax=Halorussus limi TaxID=2938695 RepID=A0A8U0HZE2_9EURY|nr:CrcB family protein [Halorussus limi]UPV76173.1 CrcB family protein [Halorussus limi]
MSETEGRSSADDESGDGATATSRVRALGRVKPLLLVAVGGFAGATLRHAVAGALPGGFLWGTLAVNVAGSFALGVLLFEAKVAGRLGAETRLVLGTGFLSSFTTYSTFALQTAALSPGWAVVNVGANYALGFLAAVAGRIAVRSLAAPGVTG